MRMQVREDEVRKVVEEEAQITKDLGGHGTHFDIYSEGAIAGF